VGARDRAGSPLPGARRERVRMHYVHQETAEERPSPPAAQPDELEDSEHSSSPA